MSRSSKRRLDRFGRIRHLEQCESIVSENIAIPVFLTTIRNAVLHTTRHIQFPPGVSCERDIYTIFIAGPVIRHPSSARPHTRWEAWQEHMLAVCRVSQVVTSVAHEFYSHGRLLEVLPPDHVEDSNA